MYPKFDGFVLTIQDNLCTKLRSLLSSKRCSRNKHEHERDWMRPFWCGNSFHFSIARSSIPRHHFLHHASPNLPSRPLVAAKQRASPRLEPHQPKRQEERQESPRRANAQAATAPPPGTCHDGSSSQGAPTSRSCRASQA